MINMIQRLTKTYVQQKRLFVDAVYSSANLEEIAVTFAQTQDILNNVNVSKLTPIEINKVCCLRDAQEYMIEHINDSLDLGYLMNVHEIIARFDVPYQYLGRIMTDDVIISGTNWRPEVHGAEYYHKEIMKLLDNSKCYRQGSKNRFMAYEEPDI